MWNQGKLNLYVELRTFKSGTFMWNLGEPGARFPAAAPNHPEALLEEPQAFQAVGEKTAKEALPFCPPPKGKGQNGKALKKTM